MSDASEITRAEGALISIYGSVSMVARRSAVQRQGKLGAHSTLHNLLTAAMSKE
jgi:hypothetical protein